MNFLFHPHNTQCQHLSRRDKGLQAPKPTSSRQNFRALIRYSVHIVAQIFRRYCQILLHSQLLHI